MGISIKYCNLRLKSIVGIDETSSLALLLLHKGFQEIILELCGSKTTSVNVLVIGFGFCHVNLHIVEAFPSELAVIVTFQFPCFV
jgi:hypothetical protein